MFVRDVMQDFLFGIHPQERGFIVTAYLTNFQSIVLTQRAFHRHVPCARTIKRLAEHLVQTGSTTDIARSDRPRNARLNDNIAAVADDVRENPPTSTTTMYTIRHQQTFVATNFVERFEKIPLQSANCCSIAELLPADLRTRIIIFYDNMTEPNLISSVILQGREYLVKMNVCNRCLDLLISDKQSGEEWQCSYDHSYIENLTHKTGNFKQFDIFIAMIKSGLLKTSECISLELLTFEDLDSLRSKKIRGNSRHFSNTHGNNKRYLIVTYTVEFDRIHYPLPLEYCGPPDPAVLQATIRKLEAEVAKLKDENHIKYTSNDSKQIIALQRRIDDLTAENQALRQEICDLNQVLDNAPNKQVKVLQRAIVNLEKSVLSERRSHHKLVEKLRNDKIKLVKELERVKGSERNLKVQMDQYMKNKHVKKYDKRTSMSRSNNSLETVYRKPPTFTRSHSEGRKDIRPRSVSPRLVKSEGWQHQNKVPNLKSSKQRSRSSSLSSSRNYPLNDFFAMEADVVEDKLDKRFNRGHKKQNRSRSSSANSSNSSGISEAQYGRESVRSIKAKLRNSAKEFNCLEKRIQVLQGILKDNLHTKNF
ncbi:hypothetical protein MML48_2g00001031 [Holotrichia oblita]|uniref:Uncharacterized protein n=1 Tax=Holotrichia oblita TaxID=644536 RepID=A0ACB9TR58_HOLOL|nr:hypothetical protein MML48_2g00001031 [Holotrichia oblita]